MQRDTRLRGEIMYTAISVILCIGPVCCFAPEAVARDIATKSGAVYTNISIIRVDPDGIHLRHDSGITKVQFFELADSLQEEFGFNPEAAKSYRAQKQHSEALWRAQQQATASDHLDYYANRPNSGDSIILPGVHERTSWEKSSFNPLKSSLATLVTVYETSVESDDDDILRLNNDALIQITLGTIGYVSDYTSCVLFEGISGWNVWIEGEGLFVCDVVREPNYLTSTFAEKVMIQDVRADGAIIVLDNGSIYEVEDTFDTAMWMSYSEALLFVDSRLLNLAENDAPVDVTLIR